MVERVHLPTRSTAYDGNKNALKYDAKVFPRIAGFLASRGATIAEIADVLGVKTRCMFNWLNRYPALQAAVKKGQTMFDSRVERAMAECAIGFAVDVEEPKIVNGEVEIVEYRKYYPPDATAGVFWLKHHKPDEYCVVHEHKHTGELKSSETLRLEFLAEVKALMNEGLLSEAEFAQMKTINGKSGNGHG